MQIPLASVLLGALSCLATAADASSSSSRHDAQPQTTLTLWIPSSQQLPAAHVLPASTHATLTALGASYRAPLSTAASFVFRNVTPGSYLADVHCRDYAFAPLRVDVVALEAESGGKEGKKGERVVVKAWETYRGNDWGNKGQEATRSGGEDGGFAVRVLGYKEYFTERGACEYFPRPALC